MNVGQLKDFTVDFFFPRKCVGCGKGGDFLCNFCLQRLPRIVSPFCDKCGRPISTAGLCPTCWGWQAHIDGIRSPFRFDGAIRSAVYELKYHNLKAVSDRLAILMSIFFFSNPLPCDVIVPVPLHSRRLKQRGYNQSCLLADKLGKIISLPVVKDSLLRCKDNVPQAKTATLEERLRNVEGVFVCKDSVLTGKQVMLVDDVCTSAATMEACAAALKDIGAASVWGFALAREI